MDITWSLLLFFFLTDVFIFIQDPVFRTLTLFGIFIIDKGFITLDIGNGDSSICLGSIGVNTHIGVIVII